MNVQHDNSDRFAKNDNWEDFHYFVDLYDGIWLHDILMKWGKLNRTQQSKVFHFNARFR